MKKVTIFTDGSSRGNPGPGGFGAICAYPNSHDEICVKEIGGREDVTTNNRMEMMALIEAFSFMLDYYAKDEEKMFDVFIDSSYVLNGAKEWRHGWKKKNWITAGKEDVKNVDLWKKLDVLLEAHESNKVEIQWHLIKGHAGTPGNERCDEIATTFADNDPTVLFDGKLADYELGDIFSIVDIGKTKTTSSSTKGKVAYSYVSFVDGQLHIDKTWAECEKRVKGKSGAKFKKSISAEDEKSIVSELTKS